MNEKTKLEMEHESDITSSRLDLPKRLVSALEIILLKEMKTKFEKPPQDINSPEELMEKAASSVSEIWQNEIKEIVGELAKFWAEELGNSEIEMYFKRMLNDTNNLEERIRFKYFSELEGIREINPMTWRSLVSISMLRQQQEMELLNRWVKNIPEEKFADWELDKKELEIALAIVTEIGPLINQTYLKQMQLGFTEKFPEIKSEGSKELGAIYLYELADETKVAYKNMFPETWPMIAKKFKEIAAKVTLMFPEKGKLFSEYLIAISNAYELEENDFKINYDAWVEIEQIQKEISASDWRIDLLAGGEPYITKKVNKMDANLVVGLKTKKTKEMKIKCDGYMQIANEILKGYSQMEDEILPGSVNMLLFAAGNGTFWRNQGEGGNGSVSYINSIKEVNQLTILPIYQELFGDCNIDELAELSSIATFNHESGHCFFSLSEEEVKRRVGFFEQYIEMIDEIKADTTGLRIFWEKAKNQPNPEQARKMLQLVVAYCLEYVKTDIRKEGDIASHKELGSLILTALLESNSLIKDGDKYIIHDVASGFKAITDISDEMLKKFANPETTPEIMSNYADSIIQRNKENKKLQEFLLNNHP